MKKLVSIFLALVMILAISIPAFAAEDEPAKWATTAEKTLFEKFVQMATAQGSTYEQMSQINEDGQKIQVFKAPYGALKSEYLVLISKDNACLVCDITGNISMKDIMGMLYGK